MSVEVNHVSKMYKMGKGNKIQALQDVSLEVEEGEFVCLLGPSGCGKSTLLRLIAGIESPGLGHIHCAGEKVTGIDQSRGFVFQDYALFHWRSVRRNIQFGLENLGVSRKEQKRISDYYLELIGLQHVANAYPSQLSGGMKQRVAIARALCLKPKILLMDEPFGALDAMTRLKMQDELIRIWKMEGITIIFVTHDVEEAVYLADRVAVMGSHPGHVKEIVNISLPRPRSRTDADFGVIREQILSTFGLSSKPSNIERQETAIQQTS